MKSTIVVTTTAAWALLLGACTAPVPPAAPSAPATRYVPPPPPPPSRPTASMSLDRYKHVLARHISQVNADKVFAGNPQAMLRSVVVVKYVVDANGRLAHSEIVRSNGDSAIVATTMSALRNAAPYPLPPSNLLERGRLEVLETLLFNDDGRFQLRTIAEPQRDE
ncbi:MAG: TonB family protein [Burkholderiaceae bacterium]|nr:TonB family protein [Burkholderiaceae bacterium]